jgi:hypothetical protein
MARDHSPRAAVTKATSCHWYFTDDDHLGWRIENQFLMTFFEGGILGLAALILLIAAALLGAVRGIRLGRLMAACIAASLVGFLVCCPFDCLLDSPRLATAVPSDRVLRADHALAAIGRRPEPRIGLTRSTLPMKPPTGFRRILAESVAEIEPSPRPNRLQAGLCVSVKTAAWRSPAVGTTCRRPVSGRPKDSRRGCRDARQRRMCRRRVRSEMNAVDNMQSYAQIARACADNTQRLATGFAEPPSTSGSQSQLGITEAQMPLWSRPVTAAR